MKKENKKDIEAQAISLIKDKKLMFIDHLVAHLPISRSTFYEWELHKSDTIKDAMNEVLVSAKRKMLSEWFSSPNPTLQIAFFKLIANDDEFTRLTAQKLEHSGGITQQIIFQEVETKPEDID